VGILKPQQVKLGGLSKGKQRSESANIKSGMSEITKPPRDIGIGLSTNLVLLISPGAFRFQEDKMLKSYCANTTAGSVSAV